MGASAGNSTQNVRQIFKLPGQNCVDKEAARPTRCGKIVIYIVKIFTALALVYLYNELVVYQIELVSRLVFAFALAPTIAA